LRSGPFHRRKLLRSPLPHSRLDAGSEIEERLIVRSVTGERVGIRNVLLDGMPVEFTCENLGGPDSSLQIVSFKHIAETTAGIFQHKAELLLERGPLASITVPITLVVR
jgi:hypothetical protein